MSKITRRVLVLALAVSLGAVACGEDDDDNGNNGDDDVMEMDVGVDGEEMPDTTPDTEPEPDTMPDTGDDAGNMATVTFEPTDLPASGENHVWEGWLIVDGDPVSTGTFTQEEGTDTYEWEVPAEDANNATHFVLSLEPADDEDEAPANTKLLAGELTDGEATATIGSEQAIGTDFSEAAGSYLLNTPTTGDNTDDYNMGIWWLVPAANENNDGDSPVASLDLPTLEEGSGWTYEGWVFDTSGDEPNPTSTGTFTDPASADSDGAGENSGEDDAPAFPGQDFINNNDGEGFDLTTGDYRAVISVEPNPDNADAPFALKPLVDETIDDEEPPVTQEMSVSTDNLPEATVTIE